MSIQPGLPEDATFIPQMCHGHNVEVVHALGIPEAGPWRSALIITGILLFQAASADDRVWQRCSLTDGTRDAKDLSLVLAEIGCLACFKPSDFDALLGIMKEHGLTYAAELSRGLRADDKWPTSKLINPNTVKQE